MNPLLTTVATEVASEFGSRLSAILSPTRGLPVDARARAIAMRVYRQLAPQREGKPLSYTDVGRAFDRDRTTVRHALERVSDWQHHERGFDRRLGEVIGRIQARM